MAHGNFVIMSFHMLMDWYEESVEILEETQLYYKVKFLADGKIWQYSKSHCKIIRELTKSEIENYYMEAL